ncbi:MULTISPECIES: DegT/DnrJ/EryC1/StrS aminotransferase family protein [Acidobacteriaceae]|uniref:DegT/DnrJ/EryC1/StrS family aminotransferase n=1 Tax=Acidobacteriaceae TaxID=204434 RepID=UPI00131D79D4|nr:MULTISPECIES: DegT/DnrJ/EryC1/StrS family aminotransferase [Acidobacteriaceae]MDW5266515.1 DegT/DnrJ/EryC1/StrS family aminotransferase [Edaphobacter sp.]
MTIPLSSTDITDAEIEAVTAVLRTSRLSLGPQMVAFEDAMANYIGTSHAIAVSSGTAGLHLCIKALGIGEGDEVIVPSFTFIAAANAIRYEGAQPVFVDIDAESLNMSPASIEQAITPKTRAILVVHTFGRPAEMEAIMDIASRHHLLVIEDACEAIGATYQGRKAGSFGDAAVFAFYPNKQITTGEGGMVVTRRSELAAHIRALRNQGRYDSTDWLQHAEVGYNYRLSEINCALGLAQLQRIEAILQQRDKVARQYQQSLAEINGLILPATDVPGIRISWFVYVVRLEATLTEAGRDSIVAKLTNAGIGCGRYFAPIHMQPSYAAWRNSAALPVTEAHASRTIALPFFNRITEDEIAQVSDTLRSALLQIQDR